MYKNNLVTAISCEDKFLHETKDGEVFLPFQTEYSIFIKNKNTRKALISVYIDGKDVLNGNKLILNSQDSINLERFVTEDLDKGNKFKFIKKTEAIINHRGNFPEDSLVELRFKFEK